MDDRTRRAVAYIAGRLAGQPDSNHVFDHGAGGNFSFSGTVESGRIQVYDYSAHAHISGSQGSLFHHGNMKHINLETRGGSLSGFDYASMHHFSGTVTGSSISIYDHETNRHHQYSV